MNDGDNEGPTQGQYCPGSLARYEWIFGADFLSSGAQETALLAARALELGGGHSVLDVGSGFGGAAFYFASAYGAHVTGLDVLPQMAAEAQRRAHERRAANVVFVCGDVLTGPLPSAPFDAVYSKDSFLHIHGKDRLMTVLFGLLAPGGRIYFSDYLRGRDRGSEEFESYVADSAYGLAAFEGYRTAMQRAGFIDAVCEDRTDRLIEILVDDLAAIRAAKAGAAGPSGPDLDYLIARWELKLRCLRAGDMQWGSFFARRPK